MFRRDGRKMGKTMTIKESIWARREREEREEDNTGRKGDGEETRR